MNVRMFLGPARINAWEFLSGPETRGIGYTGYQVAASAASGFEL
jgi:hypothetical protein